MVDRELEALKLKRWRELQKRLNRKESKAEKIDEREVLSRIFRDRAWEVFNTASYQFPEPMRRVRDLLVRSTLSGKLKNVSGEQLYSFLRRIGLGVKLNTKITYADHGEMKSLAEKMKESANS